MEQTDHKWGDKANEQVFLFIDSAYTAAPLCAAMSAWATRRWNESSLVNFYYLLDSNNARYEIRCTSWFNSICFDQARVYAHGYLDARKLIDGR